MEPYQSIDLGRIYGRIEYVEYMEDYCVRVVDHSPDLRVQLVPFLADSPGKWEIVDMLPDYRIKIVEQGEDFTIEYVDYYPG